MTILGLSRLHTFGKSHAGARKALAEWVRVVQNESWNSPQAALRSFPRSSSVGGNRLVFRIRGNNYRLIVQVNFALKIIEIRFIGTHAEYDKIDAETI